MRVLLLHSGLRNLTGSERRTLITAEFLAERGHDVTLATVDRVNWPMVLRVFGTRPKFVEKRLSPLPSLLPYTYVVPLSLMEFRKMSREFDLTINMQGEVLPAAADILYLAGGPLFTIKRHLDLYDSWLRTFPGWRYVLYRTYFSPYAWYLDRLYPDCLRNSSVLLTNSAYSARIIQSLTGKKPAVVYPPVNIDRFGCANDATKRDLVLSVGRFSAEKSYEIVPRIAKLCPNYEFIIAGTVTSRTVVDKLKRESSPRRVSNLRILLNVPIDQLKSLYGQAKFYLHSHVTEGFGQAVVEAMSACCIPLVPRSGGPWLDIIEQGKYGIGYSDETEAAQVILNLGEREAEKMRFLAKQRSEVFSENRYKNEIAGIAEALHETHVSGAGREVLPRRMAFR